MRVAVRFAAVVLSLAVCHPSVAADFQPVPVTGGIAELSPENTLIQFVGTHTGDKPDPRTGTFAKFSGQLSVDPASKSVKAISADIDTASLVTPIPKLTDHLKSPDFFEVREYPKAKFESTKIEADKAGVIEVTGNLSLHGKTKSITFPAKVSFAANGVTLQSEFSINRSEFGMTYGAGKVDDKVTLTVVVGQAAQPK